jgi:hypothetical protein
MSSTPNIEHMIKTPLDLIRKNSIHLAVCTFRRTPLNVPFTAKNASCFLAFQQVCATEYFQMGLQDD